VQPPTRKGFGTQAIEKLLAQEIDGKAILVFAPEGLRCFDRSAIDQKTGQFD
jgi:two-component sensor histidine kinase